MIDNDDDHELLLWKSWLAKKCYALFPAEAILRGSSNRTSQIHHERYFNLCSSSAEWNLLLWQEVPNGPIVRERIRLLLLKNKMVVSDLCQKSCTKSTINLPKPRMPLKAVNYFRKTFHLRCLIGSTLIRQ